MADRPGRGRQSVWELAECCQRLYSLPEIALAGDERGMRALLGRDMPGHGADASLRRRRLEFLDGWLVRGLCGWHGAASALWALIGFLVTYSLTRWITRRIRARSAGQQAQQG